MRSRTHRRHFGYIVDDRCYYGIPDTMRDCTVVAEWIRLKQARDRQVTPGVKVKKFVHAVVMRTPVLPVPAARLLARERQYVCDRVHGVIGGTMMAQAHLGPTGDTDIHFLVSKEWHRKDRPHVIFRSLFDQIHDELNVLREQEGRPTLPTMRTVRQQQLRARGIRPLEEQLADAGPVDDTNLAAVLTGLGHCLGPAGITSDYVEVIHAGGKRAFRYRKDKLLAGCSATSAATDGVTAKESAEAKELPRFDREKFLREISAFGYRLGPEGLDETRNLVQLEHPASQNRRVREPTKRDQQRPPTLQASPRPLVLSTQMCDLNGLLVDLARLQPRATLVSGQPLALERAPEAAVANEETSTRPSEPKEHDPDSDANMDV